MKTPKENNIKFYPLTESQHVMFLNLKWSFGHEEIVNICASMHFETEIDPNLLLQAISLAMLRNKSAAIRLRKVGKDIMQYFSQQAPEAVIVMDYSNETQEKYDEDMRIFSSTPFPNNSMDTQLYSIRLIKKPDGLYAIYFCVSHMVFDAYALIATANEVLTMYECLRDGLPIPENKCDPIPLFEKEAKYLSSPQLQKDIDFFDNEVYGTEPLYSDFCGMPRTVKKGKTMRYGTTLKLGQVKAKSKQLKIEADLVNKVNKCAAENKVSPLSYYTLAARSFISKINNMQEDFLFSPCFARRGTLAEKRAYGTRVIGIKMRLNMPNTLPLKEALDITHETSLKVMSHTNVNGNRLINIFEKKFDCPPMHGYETFYLTYNPVFPTEHKDLPFHFTLHHNGASAMPIYLTIMPLDNSGALTCSYDYQFATTKPDTVDSMHKHFILALEAMTENPEITVGDLAKL